MTLGGWINMLLSVGFVTILTIYCTIRVLRGPAADSARQLGRIEPVEESEADLR